MPCQEYTREGYLCPGTVAGLTLNGLQPSPKPKVALILVLWIPEPHAVKTKKVHKLVVSEPKHVLTDLIGTQAARSQLYHVTLMFHINVTRKLSHKPKTVSPTCYHLSKPRRMRFLISQNIPSLTSFQNICFHSTI